MEKQRKKHLAWWLPCFQIPIWTLSRHDVDDMGHKVFCRSYFLQRAALAANYKTKWNFNKCVFQTARRRLWERNTKHHQNKHHNFQTKVFRPKGGYLAVLWLHLGLVALCYFEFLQDLASEVWNWVYFIVLRTMETDKKIFQLKIRMMDTKK